MFCRTESQQNGKGNHMSKFYFYDYIDYEDGKMAHVCTTDINEIPLNIHIDNDDEYPNPKYCECEIDVAGVTGEINVYKSSEAYYDAGTGFADMSLIPAGTFSVSENADKFRPSADIIFSGQVLDVQWNPSSGPDEPNCCIRVATLGFEFSLYLEYHGEIKKGYIVSGTAWLFGEIKTVFPRSEVTDIPNPDLDEEDEFSEETQAVSTDEMIRCALGKYVRMICKNTDLIARYEGRIDEYTVSAPGWISSVQGHFLRVGSRSFRWYEIQDIEVLWGTEADVLRGKITGETIQEYIHPLTDAQIAFLADVIKVDLEDFPFLAEDKIGDICEILAGIETEETAGTEPENLAISERGRTAAEIAAVIDETLRKQKSTIEGGAITCT